MQMVSCKIKGTIGFVPTMGFLHEGHLSLVKAAQNRSDNVIVSIYVNPSQFAPDEDLDNYPRDLDKDIELLNELQVDYIFFPNDKEMYPADFKTWVSVDKLTTMLCGKSRPTHFRGVTTIVTKLINIIRPDFMFLGEKDFQQLTVLKQMTKDLNLTTEIIGCPLVREPDGLAMSSRNKYLTIDQRKNAISIYKALLLAQDLFTNGHKTVDKIISKMKTLINQHKGTIDYIDVVDSSTLESIENLYVGCRIVVAVYFGKTRLIDNIEIK